MQIPRKPLPNAVSISQLTTLEYKNRVAEHDVLLIGEEHENLDHYLLEQKLMTEAAKVKPIILATEYFSPDQQAALDISKREGRLIRSLEGWLEECLEDKEAVDSTITLYSSALALRACEKIVGINHQDPAEKDRRMVQNALMHKKAGRLMMMIVGNTHTEQGRVPYHLTNTYARFTTLHLGNLSCKRS